jgi:hypothetical protein
MLEALAADAERARGPWGLDLLLCRYHLNVARREAEHQPAIDALRAAIAGDTAVGNVPLHLVVGWSNDLGATLTAAGRRREAIAAYWQALDLGTEVLPADHPHNIRARAELAVLHDPARRTDLGRAQRIARGLREAAAALREG